MHMPAHIHLYRYISYTLFRSLELLPDKRFILMLILMLLPDKRFILMVILMLLPDKRLPDDLYLYLIAATGQALTRATDNV